MIFTECGNPKEVISWRNMSFDKIKDVGLAEVCTLWVVFASYYYYYYYYYFYFLMMIIIIAEDFHV